MQNALDLELIRTFLAVLDAKGFKPAAARLSKTPAAISMQIKRLEEILGDRVLERSNKGISLTPAGEILKEKGQQLMILNYELLSELHEDELAGPLTFGAPADYAPTLLEQLLPIFQREFPQVRPNIILEPSRLLRPRVNAGTLDMAIVAKEPGTREGYDLWTEENAWFGNATDKEGKHRIGILTTDCLLRDSVLSELEAGLKNHSVVLQASTVASLHAGAKAGFCQAFLPESVASGIKRSTSSNKRRELELTFSLIFGPRFDAQTSGRVAQKFQSALVK